MNHSPIRLFVDHEDTLMKAGLTALLGRCSDLNLSPEGFGDGIDVVVTDYTAGMRHVRERTVQRRAHRVVVLTHRDGEEDIRYALAKGVDGYLIVGCPVDSIADAARAVHRGMRHLDPVATHRIVESMFHEPLTGRETEVLQLVAAGCANKVIAARLRIGVGTVKTHMRSLLDKLDAASRTEAAAVAHRRGLLREASHAVVG